MLNLLCCKSSTMMIAVAYWVLLLVITAVQGFQTGAPTAACINVVPRHFEFPPSTDPLPYEVDISEFTCESYIPGQEYKITLRSASDLNGKDFKGFMIQARVMADDSPVGVWNLSSLPDKPAAQTVCPNNTAVTHIDNSEKTSITLSWKAPPAGTGPIRFKYAFVNTYSLYWANLYTKVVQETDKDKCISSTPAKEIISPTPTILNSVTELDLQASSIIDPADSFSITESPFLVPISTVASSITFSSPTFSSPTPTSPPPDPVTPPPSEAPVSCESVTGYPECTPDFCQNHRLRFARCSARIDSCSSKCQVTTCRVCIFTDQQVDLPKECVEEVCTNLKCVVKWSRCAYEKILTFQMKESDRKPEHFKCFIPNCY